jgi:hypothetical protein
MYWLVFRRYAPFESFGGGFEGDNRKSASAKLDDTARTVGAVEFSPGHVGPVNGFSSGTEYVGGGQNIAKRLGKHFSKVNASVSVKTRSIDLLRFTAQTSGSNPMVPLAPKIDTFVDVQVVFGKGRLQIQGAVRGDDFPNAEVFIVDRFGGTSLLFAFETTGGKETGPITRLWGAHEKQEIGTFFNKVMLDESGCMVGCAS